MSKKSDKQDEEVIMAQGMLDSAPSKGKSSYVKLPEGLKFFVPEKNRTYHLIFLPWKAGKGNPSGAPGNWVTNRYIPVHKNVGPGEETYLCSSRAFGKPCAVCEGFQQLRAKGAEWDTLKELKFKDRELFLVHDLDDTKNPKNLQVWDESVHLFGDAFRGKIRKKPAWMAFADFKKGSIVEVEAKEKKMGKTSCTDCTLGIEIEARTEPLSDHLIKMAKSLCVDDFVVETPYAKLKKLFSQTAGDTEEEEDEDQEDQENEDDQDEDDDSSDDADDDDSDSSEEDEEESDGDPDEDADDDEDSDSEDDSESDEDEGDSDESDDDSDEGDEDEDPEPEPAPKKKAAAKKEPPKAPPGKGKKK